MENLRDVVVISGKYEGYSGVADFSKAEKTGNVTFYPIKRPPYKVILSVKDVKEV